MCVVPLVNLVVVVILNVASNWVTGGPGLANDTVGGGSGGRRPPRGPNSAVPTQMELSLDSATPQQEHRLPSWGTAW